MKATSEFIQHTITKKIKTDASQRNVCKINFKWALDNDDTLNVKIGEIIMDS